MKPEERYTEPLWIQIRRLPYLIAMGMEGAGRSGVMGSASERHAMVESLSGGIRAFPDNALIRAIAPKGETREDIDLEAYERHDEIMMCLEEQQIRSYRDLRNHIARVLNNVMGAIEARESGQVVREYKSWLLRIAWEVANAGKEGDFIGIGGEHFSAEEKEFYHELEKALENGDRETARP